MRNNKNKEFIDKIQMEALCTKPLGENGREFFNGQTLHNSYRWEPTMKNAWALSSQPVPPGKHRSKIG